MNNLKTIWHELTSRYTDNRRMTDELWSELETNYTNKDRHYHTVTHLEYLINKALEHRDKLKDVDTVMFSIFYHDLIYNVKSHDNEQQSAQIAKERLASLNVPNEKIQTCEKQILATKYHESDGDTDTNYFLDFDLAILGESQERYKEYTTQIRKEHTVYPDQVYNEGRQAILRQLLNRNRIFKTKEFYEKYELQAKNNIKNELQTLEKSRAGAGQ